MVSLDTLEWPAIPSGRALTEALWAESNPLSGVETRPVTPNPWLEFL